MLNPSRVEVEAPAPVIYTSNWRDLEIQTPHDTTYAPLVVDYVYVVAV